MDIGYFLKLMTEKNASDMFLTTGAPVYIKVEGKLYPLGNTGLPAGMVKKIAYSLMDEGQVPVFERDLEFNMAIAVKEAGRFRVNCFKQRGEVGMVIRAIKSDIPSIDQLKLPEVLKDIVMESRGLVLVVGSTGSGKSTSLAAMIDHRNSNNTGHILTIEDPIEFLHRHKKSIVNQREVGNDTENMHVALKNALRQAPDVILMGEIRDRDTMSAAIAYAQSGHLCLATMHANNSYQALNRILSFYPVEVRATMLGDLASALKAVVSQRLLRTIAGGRAPAVEVMLNTKLVSELIEKGDFSGVKEAMEKSMAEGSQTFEADIARLITEGTVDKKEGIAYADSPTNLQWRLQNDFEQANKAQVAEDDPDDEPSFTEITLDVKH